MIEIYSFLVFINVMFEIDREESEFYSRSSLVVLTVVKVFGVFVGVRRVVGFRVFRLLVDDVIVRVF